MDEYIERKVLQEAFESVMEDCTCPLHIAAEIDQILHQAPAADVAPIVHGRWEATIIEKSETVIRTGRPHCSACGNQAARRTPYCPNCGARMGGGAE